MRIQIYARFCALNEVACFIRACVSAQVEEAVARATELYGRVDGVANCVGSIVLKVRFIWFSSKGVEVSG
jgi:hypothetical protein